MPYNSYPSRYGANYNRTYSALPPNIAGYGNLPAGESFIAPATGGAILGGAIAGYLQNRGSSTATQNNGPFQPGADIEILSEEEDRRRRRRRRRRLLTASDKADIAYLVGQLGTGQMGRAAVSALLAKRGC